MKTGKTIDLIIYHLVFIFWSRLEQPSIVLLPFKTTILLVSNMERSLIKGLGVPTGKRGMVGGGGKG